MFLGFQADLLVLAGRMLRRRGAWRLRAHTPSWSNKPGRSQRHAFGVLRFSNVVDGFGGGRAGENSWPPGYSSTSSKGIQHWQTMWRVALMRCRTRVDWQQLLWFPSVRHKKMQQGSANAPFNQAASMALMQSTTLLPRAMASCSASNSALYRRSSVAAW